MKGWNLAVFAALTACSRGTGDDGRRAAASEVAPAPPERADATVRRIESRDEVPLVGLRVDARKGDWVVRGSGGVAVVSSRGRIVDFGPVGGEDALVSIEPTVFLGLDEETSVVESVEAAGVGQDAVLVKRRVLSDPALTLWTYVTFADGALRIESVATAGEERALAVTVGEIVAWGNVPAWVEGHGFVSGAGSLAGDFIAREGLGVSYAMATEKGHIVARFAKPQPGFHEWPRTGETVETIPAHGASQRRVVLLTAGKGALGDAVTRLPRYAQAALDRVALPKGLPEHAFAEVAPCGSTAPTPFARFDARADALRLPHGCWRGRLGAPGYATGPWTPAESLATAPLPQAGTLRWRVRERGAGFVPARIVLRGTAGTKDPDWGEDPSDGASLAVLYADGDGERAVPPGKYHVTVTRGFEYTQREADVTVQAGKATDVDAELERVVDTHGWITADLHVHAVPSPDAPARLEDRVRSLAGSGVEVAVATDHNAITDYGATIRERGLAPWLASIVGDEVTTRGVPLGHFNVFPLAPGADPVPFDHATPAEVASAARAAAPPGDKVVQLNHPRMGSIGYFELLRFDPRDVAGWRTRSPLADTGFDAIEVFNGDHYAEIPEVERAMRDWYALLDAGVRITATGNSDSHRVSYHECGVPRNLVRVDDDDPGHWDADHAAHEAAFVAAVRAGHVVVSSGPFVRVDVDGAGPGDDAAAGSHTVHVTVDAPPWVDVTRVELVHRGGETLHTWTGPFAAGTRRLDAKLPLDLAAGDWIVAVARGEREMRFLPRSGAKPFAFTNPVWVR
ncbi:MAG TPA: CehA/McbA family metallohydrolase [Polyangiaceae bacterium]|nr:CehA/McbA family metallohydrolase [Polyangiaceae bacterium]